MEGPVLSSGQHHRAGLDRGGLIPSILLWRTNKTLDHTSPASPFIFSDLVSDLAPGGLACWRGGSEPV